MNIQSMIKTVLFLLLIVSHSVSAEIESVRGNAIPNKVSITSTGQSSLSWRVSHSSKTGGQVVISSMTGSFYSLDGTLLAETEVPLQVTRIAQPGSTLFSVRESLLIPLTIIRQVQKSGGNRFIYLRTFNDNSGGESMNASVTFSITGGSVAGELLLTRIQLEFDDGRNSGILVPGTKIKARALLTYQGTGLLEYSWQVASPPSTQGKPVFSTMVSRKQYLLSGGSITLQSPDLLTQQPGDYLVRLNVHKLDDRFEMPIIRYVINASASSRTNRQVEKLRISFPAEDALLTAHTQFSWKAVNKAAAYQIEIYSQPDRVSRIAGQKTAPPVTGVLIPATKTKMKISDISRAHLLSGSVYYWQVVAFSENGDEIARSDYRRIKF